MRIYTHAQMKSWILSRLGIRLIDVELDLESNDGFGHVDLAISDSIDWFVRHSNNEGSYKDWMVMRLEPGIHTYDVPDDVNEICRANSTYGGGFTPFTGFDVGARESLVSTTGWANFDLLTYVIGQMYLSDVSKYIGRKYDVKMFPAQHKVKIQPTPQYTGDSERYVMFEVYRTNALEELYNVPELREYMLGKAMVDWGHILGKNKVTLPGGVSVDGAGILSRGQTLMKDYGDALKSQFPRAIISLG